MVNPLIVGIGGSLIGAGAQARSAKKAAGAASDASEAQIAESRRQFDLVRNLLQPYVTAGSVGLAGQMDLMGVGGTAATTAYTPQIETIAGRTSPIGSGSLGSLLGGVGGNTATTFRVDGKTFNTMAEAQAFATKNTRAANPGISAADAQRAAIGRITNSEQFKELTAQGEYGIMANASATGGLRGGDTQGALAQFRPAVLQGLIDRQLAQFGGLAANGQNAAGNVGAAAQNAAGMINQSLGERGAAQGGAFLAGGQAFGNAIGGITGGIGQFSGMQQSGALPAGATMFGRWGF